MDGKWRVALVAGLVGMALACGGGGAPSQYGSVELTRYEQGKIRLVFGMDGKVTRTWRHMAGDPVVGTWTQSGEKVDIHWPKVDNFGRSIEQFKQTGPCSITMYHLETYEGNAFDRVDVFQRTQPRCDAVQLR